MSFNVKKWCRLPVVVLVMLCLPGCWDYQKINDRAQIIGIGVDPVPGETNLLSYTLQVPVLESGGQSGGAQEDPSKQISGEVGMYRNFTIRARGVNDAVTQAQTQFEKMFYLGNLQTVVLNRNLTANQVQYTIAEMLRTPFLDKLAWLLFTSQPAKEILQTGRGAAPADQIDRFLGLSLKVHGLTIRTRLWEFWRDARQTGVEPHAGMVRTQKDGLQVYGVMAFKATRPTIELGSPDTVYFNFIDGGVQRLSMWIQDGPRAFEVHNIAGGSKLWVSIQDGQPRLHVSMRTNAILVQDETGGSQHLSEREMRRYESVMEKQVVRECGRVLKEFQQRQIDAFGFGEYVYIHHLKSPSEVEQHWPEEFAKAPVDLEAKVVLVQKGNLM